MSRSLPLGITTFVTDQGIDPVQLAREVEARGFHSLYIAEHTHIPTSRRTPPPTGDATLPEEDKRTVDPFGVEKGFEGFETPMIPESSRHRIGMLAAAGRCGALRMIRMMGVSKLSLFRER